MKYIFILLLLPIKLFAQDISGVWTGYLYNDTTKQNIHYELAISELKGKPTGYSHTTFVIDSIENIGVKSVNIKEKNGHFYIVDDELIFDNYPEPPAKGVKQFSFLTLAENDSAEVLSGMWRTNATRLYNPLTGTVYLEKKKKKPEETLIVSKLAQLGLVNKLSFLTPSTASKLTALNNKPAPDVVKRAQPETISVTEKLEPNTDKKKTKPLEQEKTVTINEKKLQQPPVRAVNEPVPAADKKKTVALSSPVIKDSKSVVNAASPTPMVVAEQKMTEKPITVLQPKQEEKKIVVKEIFAPNEQKNQVVVTPKAPPQPEKKPAEPPAATEIAKRSLETIRTIAIARDSLVFSLYDNGAVDGDTVSVLLNGQVIMPRVGLLERATNKTIYLTPDMGDSVSIIMYAENLGSIPPNTGLLVIREGEKIYEIRFSGDLNKNSKIILVRKKEN